MIRKLLIVIMLLVLSPKAFSQLKIVKDNIACLYGLKNQEGKWIVPASYILIEEFQGYYKVTTDEGRGVLTSDGNVLVRASFDMIELLNTGFFRATIKNKYTLINPQGKMLCQPVYNSLVHDPNGIVMLYRQEDDLYKTTCIDTEGNILIPETKGFIAAFGAWNYALIGRYPGHDNSVSGEAGVIDRSGNLLIPRQYEFLKHCDGRFIFRKEYKTGIVDVNNKIILEAKYQIISHDGSTPCIRETDILKISDNTKIGFMRGTGEVLIEPVIDELVPLYPDQQTPKAMSLFSRGGKMGIISKDYKITVDAVYDTLIPRPRITWNEPHASQQNKKTFFQFSQNGKYGLLKDDGTIICPAEYDNFLRSDYAKKPGYFLTKGQDIFLLDFNAEVIVPEKAKLVARHDTLLIFESRGELLPCFVRKKNNRIAAMGSEHFEYRTYGEIFAVATRNGYHYFTTDGKTLYKNKIQYIDFNQGKYCQLHTKTGKKGLYHPGLKKLVLDTLYEEINPNYAQMNFLWARLPYNRTQNQQVQIVNPLTGNYELPRYEWILLDTNGQRVNKTVFDAIVYENDTTIAYSEGLTGVVDSKMNWLLKPAYRKILRISKNYFAVMSRGGKYGVADLQDKLVLDTVYTDVEEIFIGMYSDWKYPYSKLPETKAEDKKRWYLFTRNGEEMLFDTAGEKLSSAKVAEREKIERKLVDFAFRGSANAGNSSFKIQALPYQDSLLSLVKYREQLYRFLQADYDTADFCNPLELAAHPYYRVPESCYRVHREVLSLKSLGEKHICIENLQQRRESWGEMYEPMNMFGQRNSYQNLVWRNGSLEKLQLKMIYPNIEILEGELIRVLQRRDDLRLSCTSPANILEQIGEDFCLSREGLVLFYKDAENYLPVEFLITRERLGQDPVAKWITDYLD